MCCSCAKRGVSGDEMKKTFTIKGVRFVLKFGKYCLGYYLQNDYGALSFPFMIVWWVKVNK